MIMSHHGRIRECIASSKLKAFITKILKTAPIYYTETPRQHLETSVPIDTNGLRNSEEMLNDFALWMAVRYLYNPSSLFTFLHH